MKITKKEKTIKEVFSEYRNDEEEGVTAYGGKLDIRPKYQREFVYLDKEQKEVIHTIVKNFPLNVIYWCKKTDANYEVLDGQQRIMSFCEYLEGNFSVDFGSGFQYFHNLPNDIKEKIYSYKLDIYICDGNESEKLDWFRIINIAGKTLTDQELRNAVYSGPWVTNAKKFFSKTGCPAYQLGKDYLSGYSIRQDYLETTIKWISDKESISIEEYMGKHQADKDATPLWEYFEKVIDWVKEIFPVYRKEMKGLDWGFFYNKYHDQQFDSNVLEKRVAELYDDYDVTKKKGVFEYILSGNEKALSIRGFDDRDKRNKYTEQKHKCAICGKERKFEEMHADHITPWSKGGKTIPKNLQMLCTNCNLKKSADI